MKMTAPKALLSVLVAVVIIILCQMVAGLVGFLPVPMVLGSALAGIVYTLSALLLLKLYCRAALHCTLAELRIPKPGFKGVWIAVALALPLLVSGVYLLLPGSCSVGDLNAEESLNTVVTALLYIGMGAGVVEEALFRGLIMTALEKRWSRTVAVVVPSVVFALLHVFNAPLDALSFIQLLLAGTTVGIMFSLITLHSGSIWNSALVHALWNAAIIGRLLHIGPEPDASAIMNFSIDSDSFLLTGGDFGIEASVISLAGYALVIALAACLLRKNGRTADRPAEDNAANG